MDFFIQQSSLSGTNLTETSKQITQQFPIEVEENAAIAEFEKSQELSNLINAFSKPALDIHQLSKQATSPNEIQEYYRTDLLRLNEQISSILSATAVLKNSIKERFETVPVHPYERWRYQYIDPNKPLKTIYDLQFSPAEFDPITATQQISALNKKYYELSLLQMQSLTSEELEPTLNIFANLSGNKFVVDEDKMREHIEFHELLRTMPLKEIENAPYETACKLITEFIRVYS